MRFIDNKDGTITDNETGLIWSKKTYGPMTWAEAMEAVKKDGGWRMPTIQELITLINHEKYDPACDEVFGNMKGYWIWSSTTYVPSSAYAWDVNFSNGYVSSSNKTNNRYARPVRNAAI